MRRAIVLALLVTACSSGSDTTSKSDNDSINAGLDTTTVLPAPEENINDEAHEAVDADTTLLGDIHSSFNAPQLNNKIAFAYRPAGLHLYQSLDDAGDSTKSEDVIAYGDKLVLAEPLINNQPPDKTEFEGFKGRYIPVTTNDGTKGYVFSGYLTNFPMPGANDRVVDYFIKNLHLVATPAKVVSKVLFDSTTPEWWKTFYKFESDVSIDDSGYYEGSSLYVTLPSSCTMQEGFLLLRALGYSETFVTGFTQYPSASYAKKIIAENISAGVDANEGEIVRIYVSDDSGCSDETFVQIIDGRIVIGGGGGC